MLQKPLESLLTYLPGWAQIVLFVVGMALGVYFLVQFCNFFVDSASAIAKKMKISPLIIGLTIVAMGTSLPELAVSTADSIKALSAGGNANLAIGNVIGSNICNLLIVLGISVCFTPIVVKKSIRKREFPILLSVSAILVLFLFLFGMNSVADLNDIAVTRWESIILAVGIVGYITYLVITAKRHPEEVDAETEEINDMPWWKAILLVIVGAIGIFLGGEFVVFGARGLALKGAVAAGVEPDLAESLVGLTIVAVGTSLPELVTSAIAAKKKQNEIALGNVIGSNIFNSLFVLGIAGTVNPLTSGNQVLVDVVVMFTATVLTFCLSLKGKLKRVDGIILLTCYAGYLSYLIARTVLGA